MSESKGGSLLPIGAEWVSKLKSKDGEDERGGYRRRRRRKGRRVNKTMVLLEEIRCNLMRLTTHLGLTWQRV